MLCQTSRSDTARQVPRGFSLLSPKLSPGIAFAQRGDVRDVVPAMPGIKRKCLVERHCFAVLGVHEFALPIKRLERSEQSNPAFVQGFEKIERWTDWGFSVG